MDRCAKNKRMHIYTPTPKQRADGQLLCLQERPQGRTQKAITIPQKMDFKDWNYCASVCCHDGTVGA